MINLVETFREIYTLKKLEKADLRSAESRLHVIDQLYSCRSRNKGEWFYILELTDDYALKKIHNVLEAEGNKLECNVKDVLRPILRSKNKKFIITHNHPSLPVHASLPDYTSTLFLKKECDKIGKKIIDHIIWAEHQFFSFQERKLIDFS